MATTLKIIAPFINVLFFAGFYPFSIDFASGKIKCNRYTIAYLILINVFLTISCIISLQLFNQQNIKFYTNTLLFIQILGYAFAIIVYDILLIVSMKNRQFHMAFLLYCSRLTFHIGLTSATKLAFGHNNRLRFVLWMIYGFFVITNTRYYFSNPGIIQFAIAVTWTWQMIMLIGVLVYIRHLAKIVVRQATISLFLFKLALSHSNKFCLYRTIKLIEQFCEVKRLYQISFGGQLLVIVTLHTIFITKKVFAISRILSNGFSAEIIFHVVLVVVPHCCVNIGSATTLEKIGSQVRQSNGLSEAKIQQQKLIVNLVSFISICY